MRNVEIGREGCGPSRLEGVGVTDSQGNKHMNTVQLIDVLSACLEPVPLGELRRTLTLAFATGGVAAFS